MVMDKNDLNKPMSGWDWQVLGHQYEKKGKITLPRCRLAGPLPSTLTECHTRAPRPPHAPQAIGPAPPPPPPPPPGPSHDMVIDKNDLNKPMSGWDWQGLAHQYEKNGKITLPRCRLDVPLPSTLNECHTLAHRLAALSQAIGQAIRLAPATRSGMLEVKGLINQARLGFADLGKEWETELREKEAHSKDSAEAREHLREVG